LKSVDSRRRSG